ncbi:MAG: hypothetical protein ACTHU0_15750 [Kofleriaceae bacterium]
MRDVVGARARRASPVPVARPSAELLEIDLKPELAGALHAIFDRARALLPGHFGFHADRHSDVALRFRALQRDPGLAELADALVESAPWSLDGVVLLSPSSAGFVLGDAIARRRRLRHAVVQTDLRRLPTKRLLAGALAPRERVVLVNDVASTGRSLDAMRELVAERGAFVAGVLLGCVVDRAAFDAYCADWKIQAHALATARWTPHPAGSDCAGCAAGLPLVPISELS